MKKNQKKVSKKREVETMSEYKLECEDCGFIWISNSDNDLCPDCEGSNLFIDELEENEQC